MKTLLPWFAASSALILVVLVLRRLLGGRLSPQVKYALWGVVLVRLLVPFPLFPGVPGLTQALEPVEAVLTQAAGDRMIYAIPTQVYPSTLEPGDAPIIDRTWHEDAGGLAYYSGGVVMDEEHITHYYFMMPADELLLLLWGAGAAGLGLVLLRSNLHFARRLRQRRQPLEIADHPLPVYTAEGLLSPCLFGLFRPCIYLTPDLAADGPARRHVLTHELTHFRQKDHLWSALRGLALALHWYDPLVWLAVYLSKRDGELSCDAGAVQVLGEAERIPYGRTLVSLVARRSLRPGDLLSCSTSMAEGKGSIQARIAQLVKRPETKKTALFAAAALLALAAVFLFAGGSPALARYETYLRQVSSAQSIRCDEPPISSTAYPDPITSPDLLEEARSWLAAAEAPSGTAGDTDWAGLIPSYYTLTLWDGSDHTYYLSPRKDGEGRDVTYILAPADPAATSYTVVAVRDGHPQALIYRMQRQQGRTDGLSFQQLAPGGEVLSPTPVTVPAGGASLTYHITYARPSLTLELGLRAQDGTEYSRQISDGRGDGALSALPAGTYQLFVRNSGDYDFDAPGYLRGDVDYDATGALLFLLEPDADAAAP